MKIRKFATITLLVLSSFAANSVAPSKTELESMYDKAFREFDSGNYEQALKDLDAIDARQPDLAESQNLRGVIHMRQKEYDKAEVALRKALAADPKFWNARFNLAEVPFLQKNWAEARKRFQELLAGNASELQGEATQLIQYKILITHLVEGKENMVDSMLAKFELTPDTPAAHYANAALALQKKNEPEAKDWLTRAEKNFSPQLNKLFAESLYSVGWLEKPAGQSRAAIELNSAADRAAKTKAFAQAKFEEAEQALQQRDFSAARKLIDEADAANPNQAPVLNMRGEILMEQKDFAGAENEFRKAAKADPKFRDAQYNLALVPFKQKDYTKARDRFEALFANTTGVDKDQAAQLIKFQIYLTLLLEGKDSRAQKMMEQFQFTGDTPALYYAQAAWEFKNNNTGKANDWVTSARKIYSPALNGVFSDSFYDLGWLQTPTAAPATAIADAGPVVDASPGIEPTPLPNISLTMNEAAKNADPLTQAAIANATANAPIPGMEATTSQAEQSPAASTAIANVPAASPSVETPVASTASPAAARPVVASAPEGDRDEAANAAAATNTAQATASPATVLAPAKVREWSEPTFSERVSRLTEGNTLFIVLSATGVVILAWVAIPAMRRRMAARPAGGATTGPATSPQLDEDEAVGPVQQLVAPTRLAGGPPQVSLQLRASEPALRRAVMPLGKTARSNGNGYTNGHGNGNGHGHGHGAALVGAAVAAPVESYAKADPVVITPEAEPFYEGVGEPQPSDGGESVSFAPPAFVEPPADEPPGFAEPPAGDEPPASDEPQSFVEPPSFIEPVNVEPSVDAAEPESVQQDTVEATTLSEAAGEAGATVENQVATEPEMAAAIETVPPQAEPMADFAPEPAFAASMPPVEAAPVEAATPASDFSMPVEQARTEELPTALEAPAVEEIAAEAPAIEATTADAAPSEEITTEAPAVGEITTEQPVVEEPASEAPAFTAPEASVFTAPEAITAEPEVIEPEAEPIGQGAPVPYQTANVEPEVPVVETPKPQAPAPRETSGGFFRTALAGIGALRQRAETRAQAPAPAPAPEPVSAAAEPVSAAPEPQQSTTPEPAIMATPTPPAPAIRTSPATPMTGAAPQQSQAGMQQPAATHQAGGGGMHTAVQLTFSFEIASLQLTQSFKMGALQLRPTSRIVTMRLAPSQQPQPAMNLQVTFEIATVQLAGGSLGMVRLTPSQQQAPTMITSPAFNIAGLQLVSGAQAAPVQLTPSQQGQASVLVTGAFQIATVEFSPSFEIASIVLNAIGKNVSVQLPGAGPSAVEGAPVFEIGNVQLAGNGEIGMMQLNPRGAGAGQQGGAPRPNA